MLLSGDRSQRTRQLGALVDGYEQFRDFDRRELVLIEPLRTLRLIHYSAWLARRWDDPTFPSTSPGLAPATTGRARCRCWKSRWKRCRKSRWWCRGAGTRAIFEGTVHQTTGCDDCAGFFGRGNGNRVLSPRSGQGRQQGCKHRGANGNFHKKFSIGLKQERRLSQLSVV
jgi:hypothetical protein